MVTAPHCIAFGTSAVAFASRKRLGVTAPPNKPVPPKQIGSYCFRATCLVHDDGVAGCPIAKVKGYDTSPAVGKDTEMACRAHLRSMPGSLRCGEAEVVMLSATDMECSGQMMFVMDGTVRRLL